MRPNQEQLGQLGQQLEQKQKAKERARERETPEEKLPHTLSGRKT